MISLNIWAVKGEVTVSIEIYFLQKNKFFLEMLHVYGSKRKLLPIWPCLESAGYFHVNFNFGFAPTTSLALFN